MDVIDADIIPLDPLPQRQSEQTVQQSETCDRTHTARYPPLVLLLVNLDQCVSHPTRYPRPSGHDRYACAVAGGRVTLFEQRHWLGWSHRSSLRHLELMRL